MRRLMVSAIAATVAAVGCADGWPRVHHHSAAVVVDCVPIATRIGRSSCTTTNPTSASSGDDLDRAQQSGQSIVRSPVSGQGSPR